MDLSELLEDETKGLVIIYPGRFHPFHIGHGKVYQYLKINYPNAQVFISTSDNTVTVTNTYTSPDHVAIMYVYVTFHDSNFNADATNYNKQLRLTLRLLGPGSPGFNITTTPESVHVRNQTRNDDSGTE